MKRIDDVWNCLKKRNCFGKTCISNQFNEEFRIGCKVRKGAKWNIKIYIAVAEEEYFTHRQHLQT